MLRDRATASAWLLFSVATSVVAAAAWPVVAHRNLRRIAVVIYAIGIAAMAVTPAWSVTVGWAMTLLGCVFIAVTGVRNRH